MFKDITRTFSYTALDAAAEKAGLVQNKLSVSLIKNGKNSGKASEDDSIEKSDILFLYQPDAMTLLTFSSRQGEIVETLVLAKEKNYAIATLSDEMVSIKSVGSDELLDFFRAAMQIKERMDQHKIVEMNLNEWIAWSCMMDTIKRIDLESRVLHAPLAFEITEEQLKEEFEIASAYVDRRWLLPFMLDTFSQDLEINVKKGIKGLVTKKYFSVEKDGNLTLTDEGSNLLTALSDWQIVLAGKSLFQHQGKLALLDVAFIRTKESLWYIDPLEEGVLKTIEEKQALDAFLTLTATGEPADLQETVKFCKYCGTEVSPVGRFCKNCGKPI